MKQRFGRKSGIVTRACSKCGGDLGERFGKQRYCKSCHAEFMRATRPKHSELPELAKKKANARAYSKEYLKRGKITKKPCEFCGCEKVEIHHEDYDKPLEVRFFCRKHHLEYHKKMGLTKRLIELSVKYPYHRDELKDAKLKLNLTDFGLDEVAQTASRFGVDFERAYQIIS